MTDMQLKEAVQYHHRGLYAVFKHERGLCSWTVQDGVRVWDWGTSTLSAGCEVRAEEPTGIESYRLGLIIIFSVPKLT